MTALGRARWIDHFRLVPDRWEDEELRRARLGMRASIAYGSLALFSSLAGLTVATRYASLTLSAAIGLVALILNPLMLRLTRKSAVAGQLLVGELLVSITAGGIANGGMTAGGLDGISTSWLVIVPLIATLLVGSRFAIFTAVLCVLQTLAMVALYRAGVQLPVPPPGEAAIASVAATCTAIAFLVVCAVINENLRNAAQTKAHLALEELRQSNAARDAIAIELADAHKLEAVGRLAAGVAHEINTPVQFVTDSVQFVHDSVGELIALERQLRAMVVAQNPALIAEIEAAEVAIDYPFLAAEIPLSLKRSLDGLSRVATIVHAMKSLSRADQQAKTATDLNAAVAAALTISKGEYKYVAELKTEFAQLPPVPCHAGQINQVVLNLICNAAHAIAEQVKGTSRLGTIEVKTSRQGDDAVIAISDTGGGIPEAVRGHIFEPFFTTKPVGKGSGQGLTICRNLVREHQGRLTFVTRLGVGTTFLIHLPLFPDDAHRAA